MAKVETRARPGDRGAAASRRSAARSRSISSTAARSSARRRALSRRARRAVHARRAVREVQRLRVARAAAEPPSTRCSRLVESSRASPTSASSCGLLTAAARRLAPHDEPGLDFGRGARASPSLLSCTTTINVGVLSLALALRRRRVPRRHVAGGGARRVSRSTLFITLIGVTLLFSIAEVQRHARAGHGARRAALPRPRGRAADHVLC